MKSKSEILISVVGCWLLVVGGGLREVRRW